MVLELAARHGPPTVQLNPKATLVRRWGDCPPEETKMLESVSRWSSDRDALLRAAQWRWSRLQYRRAKRLVKTAASLDATDPEPWRLLLQIEAEHSFSWRRQLNLCVEIRLRAPSDPLAHAVQAIGWLARDDQQGEEEARACLANPEMRGAVVAALAGYLGRQERFDEAVGVLGDELQRITVSVHRQRLESAIREFERMRDDEGYLRSLRRRRRWEKTRTILILVVVVMAITARIWFSLAPSLRASRQVAEASARLQRQLEDQEKEILAQFRALEKRANSGDPVAMLEAAAWLRIGSRGVQKDIKAAQRWEDRAIEMGSTTAFRNRAENLRNGTDGPADLAGARQWFEKAANKGDVQAMVALAEMLSNNKDAHQDDAQALAWYRKAAAGGDVQARNTAGYWLETGRGAPKDETEAYRLYLESAKAGNTWAQAKVGLALWWGDGVKADRQAAIVWLTPAAEKGDADAQVLLGKAFLRGIGVKKDETQAAALFSKAAAKGDAVAQYHLGIMKLNGAGQPADRAGGIELLERAARQHEPYAAMELALIYYRGKGVPRSEKDGAKWLAQAAEDGLKTAQAEQLVMRRFDGGKQAPSDAEVREALRVAVESEGESRIGVLYSLYCRNGMGGPLDGPEAEKVLRSVALRGNLVAKFFLAEHLFFEALDQGGDQSARMAEANQLLEESAKEWKSAAYYKTQIEREGWNVLRGVSREGTRKLSTAGGFHGHDGTADRNSLLPISRTAPICPADMTYLGAEGEVVVDFWVDREGRVRNPTAARSTNAAFEMAATTAVAQWTFEPPQSDGRATEVHVQVPVIFSRTPAVPEREADADRQKPASATKASK